MEFEKQKPVTDEYKRNWERIFGSDSYRLIPLSRGLYAKVSPEDYDHLMQWKWYAHLSAPNKGTYAKTHKTISEKKYTKVSMHREILRDQLSEGMQVDHINGDTLDNRRENLRICNRYENARNRGTSRNNETGYKGVRKNGKNGFGASVMADRKLHWLGTYRTPELAHEAYCHAAESLHGAFYKSGCPILEDKQ